VLAPGKTNFVYLNNVWRQTYCAWILWKIRSHRTGHFERWDSHRNHFGGSHTSKKFPVFDPIINEARRSVSFWFQHWCTCPLGSLGEKNTIICTWTTIKTNFEILKLYTSPYLILGLLLRESEPTFSQPRLYWSLRGKIMSSLYRTLLFPI